MSRFRISVDDAAASDVRVAELCKKYDVECIFYWPVEYHSLAYENGYEPLTFDQANQIANQFEIGSHGVTHRHLTKIPLEEAKYEIEDSKTMLEKLFPVHITKFCPPRGYTTPELTELTLKIYKEQRLTRGEGLVHIHPNSGANGNIHWLERIKEMRTNGEEVREIWGHSHEFDRFNLWHELEEVLKNES